jgi:hypothetical protein
VSNRLVHRRALAEVLRTLRTHLPELQQRHGVRSLGVFGSLVRGRNALAAMQMLWWSSIAPPRSSNSSLSRMT